MPNVVLIRLSLKKKYLRLRQSSTSTLILWGYRWEVWMIMISMNQAKNKRLPRLDVDISESSGLVELLEPSPSSRG